MHALRHFYNSIRFFIFSQCKFHFLCVTSCDFNSQDEDLVIGSIKWQKWMWHIYKYTTVSHLFCISFTYDDDNAAKNNGDNFISDIRLFISELTLATRRNRAYRVNPRFILFLALVWSIAQSVIKTRTQNRARVLYTCVDVLSFFYVHMHTYTCTRISKCQRLTTITTDYN